MDFHHLNNQTVLVTGGNKGIGKAIALTFAKLGSRIIITGRDESSIRETEKELQQFQNESYRIVMDLCLVQDIEEKTATIFQTSKTIDILVNNAGG